MDNEVNIIEKLTLIRQEEGDQFTYDEMAITNEYHKDDGNEPSLAIKILSISGGFLATLTFLGFLFLAGLYNSDFGLIIFGTGFISGAIWLNKQSYKLITDTFSISLYIIGFALLAFGMGQMDMGSNTIAILLIVISVLSLIIVQSYILSFISVLVIFGSLLALVLINDAYNMIHLYIAGVTVLLAYHVLNEADIIISHKKLSQLYNPIRIGLIISLLTGLICVGKKALVPMAYEYTWISSVVTIPVVLYLISVIMNVIHLNNQTTRTKIYVASAIMLIPVAFAPAISGAIIILLLSYLVNYKTGIAIGIISLIYFISQYYYDLNLTLLVKSGILFSSGILFLLFYLFILKKTSRDEEV